MSRLLYLVFAGLLSGAAMPGTAQPENSTDPARTVLHILDYMGVDYPGAVENGKIKSVDEFNEQREFAAQVVTTLRQLPANPHKDALITDAHALVGLVETKAAPAEVAVATTKLQWAVISAYDLQIAPKQIPAPEAALPLYREHCETCHGAQGFGNGPMAQGLDPIPANFHNTKRMAQHSIFNIYNTISLGVEGTAMPASKTLLSDQDRWTLAFLVSNFSADATQRERGAVLWQSGVDKQDFPDIGNVATLSLDEVRARFGNDAADVQTYLRAHPEALVADKPAPLDFALTAIASSVDAYRKDARADARRLALQAYLDGFELTEASLQNIDDDLMHNTERQMMALRDLMRRDAPVNAVEQQAAQVNVLLKQSKQTLETASLPSSTTFLSALLILLREGLEALLVVAAIISFLVKADRRDALPYVHAGWISAMVLGLATWAAATYAISISGANREITEGITGLFAAAMLIYVGYWLHSKATARAWQHFIKKQVGTALAKRTLWAMALISFLAVYREMFETVLFYQALWVQAETARGAFFGGITAAIAVLAAIAWGIFRYSVRLPLRLFFTATSMLLCLLAVVLAGKGIASLQEAGVLSSNLVDFPSVPLLGIFPTLQGLGVQIVVVFVIIAAFRLSTRATAAG